MIVGRLPRVVHVSSAHPWTDNRIHYRECNTLAEAGYDVTLIAVDSAVEGPATDVRVIKIRRRKRLSRMILSTAEAVLAAIKTRAQIVHLHDPELILFIPILRIVGRKVIYDAHEDLPAQVRNKPYLGTTSRLAMSWFARLLVFISQSSNAVVCATEAIANRYLPSNTTVIHNYPPLRAIERVSHGAVRERKAIYVGGISQSRGASVMIDAMSDSALPPGWRLTLAGPVSESLMADLCDRPGWLSVDFHGQVPPDAARDLMLQARVGLALLEDSEAYRVSLPTKMFEYFAAGVPVIASDFPLWRRIVENGSDACGILVDPRSPSEVASALRRYEEEPALLSQHSRNARQLALEKLNWGNEVQSLLGLYSRFGVRE